MFAHIFINRVRSISRNRSLLFWTLAFPLVLSTLFSFAFSNLSQSENFKTIPIAMVENDNLQLNETIKQLSIGEDALLEVIYTDLENAENLLKDGEIDGFISVSDNILLTVKKEGLNQTILKNILDDFIQTSAGINEIMKTNPEKLKDGLTFNSYIKEEFAKGEDADMIVTYYYALIAMGCLYAGIFGLKCIRELQPNQSAKGVRRSMAPVHKTKIFAYEFLAMLFVQIIVIFIILAYIIFVIGINFGDKIPAIMLTCVVGSLVGVSFGTCIGALVPKTENEQMGILMSITMLCSFLAGLMMASMKYIVETKAPIIADINPVNLIADSFYCLYYYDTYTRFFENIIGLFIFAGVFLTITCLVVRRENYASI